MRKKDHIVMRHLSRSNSFEKTLPPTLKRCAVLRKKLLQVIMNVLTGRCRKCYRNTCKCWIYFRSDGVCEGMLMEAVREPIILPSPGVKSPTSGGFFVRPAKPVSFPSPTGSAPPISSCYRRAASVSRHPSSGGYRTAGVYRNRSGSVPPPTEGSKGGGGGGGGITSPREREKQFSTTSVSPNYVGGIRRSIGSSFNGGTASEGHGDIANGSSQRGLIWAQLDLLQMDCATDCGGGCQTPSETDSSDICAISTEERLLKTNPIWFLADLQRKGAVHLLQGKEEGSFLVRQSSQNNTLAISVRLPPDKGPHVQHYLVEIQPQGQYSLEASDNRFDSLPSLLSYYTDCCDELPVKLKLPKCVHEAKTRHELASIALLGQEFWGTLLASPSTPPILSPPARPHDLAFSSFGKAGISNRAGIPSPLLTPTMTSEVLTPSRPAPPLPASIDRSTLNLNLSSLEDVLRDTTNTPPPSFSSFRSKSNGNTPLTPVSKPVIPPRVSPPNITTKAPSKAPPPPLRSSPPSSETSHSPSSTSNITVTTTLTFNVNQMKGFVPIPFNGGSSPQTSTPSPHEETFQLHVSSLEISPSSREGLRLHFRPPSYSSPPSHPPTPLTPLSEDGSEGKVKLRRSRGKRKDSTKGAQESSVAASACHRSSLADKISDYEDLWTSPLPSMGETNPEEETSLNKEHPQSFSSFKPRTDISRSLGDLSDVMRRESGSQGESENRKASSPFYVEPLDALREEGEIGGRKQRSRKVPRKIASNRHSDSNIEWRHRRTRRIPSNDDLSSSQEDVENPTNTHNNNNNNLNNRNNNLNNCHQRRAKPVAPPKIKGGKELPNWVDASWEFLTYVGTSQGEALTPGSLTAQALIEQRLPHLVGSDTTSSSLRHSAYDNVSRRTSTYSDSGTEFSEPWDSRKWDSLLNESRTGSGSPESLVQVTGDSRSDDSDDDESHDSGPMTLSLSQKTNNYDTNLRSKILSPQMLALRHRKDAESGAAVRRYALSLGHDSGTTFSQAIRHFLTCTLEGSEREAAVVVRNVRQFMSGMKNYLVTSGEGEFEAIVTRERSNLKQNEFLNLDAILEDVLVRLVLRPLWNHINQLFVDALTTDGSIQRLADNISYAKGVSDVKLGIREELLPPKGAALETIRMLLKKMQYVYAPREKLGHLLGIISHIYHAMYENGGCVPSTGDADDLVPMLMWVLANCNFLSAEVEADYLQGLLLPSSAGGEASYYLSAFHSAIHSLKNLEGDKKQTTQNSESPNSTTNDGMKISSHGVLRVLVPDEKSGSIATRTLPIRPGSTARELCRMMAHKLRVTNPQDFALYKLIDGNESVLGDNECPQKVRDELISKGSHCLIAFKRIDAKIAWPIIN